MGSIISTVSNVQYNGVIITDIIKSTVRSVPVFNNQGTAVKYIEHNFEIEGIINPTSFEVTDPNNTTDNALEYIRKRLLAQGKAFYYEDKGFGHDFRFIPSEVSSQRQATDYGPRPTLLVFESMGSYKAARVIWSVSVRTTECLSPKFRGLSEFWCTSSLRINRSGYQTLIRRGYLEAMASSAGTQLTYHMSENFRPFVRRLLGNEGNISMQGYHLEQEYDFSPDDRSCNFVLTYTEIESDNPYPNGVVDISCDHNVSSKLLPGDRFQVGFVNWMNTMDCTVRLRPGVDKLQAWLIFSAIASDRIQQGIATAVERWRGSETITIFKVPLVLSLDIREGIFSHQVGFNITWVTSLMNVNELFEKTGMFKKIVDTDYTKTDWSEWTGDIRSVVQNPDGAYPLISMGNTSLILTACNNETSEGITPESTRDNPSQLFPGIFELQCPPPETSWVAYHNSFFISGVAGRVSLNRYRTIEEVERGEYQPAGEEEALKIDEQYNKANVLENFNFQELGNDKFKVTMYGYAIRLGRPTRPPQIRTIGGHEVRVMDDENFIASRTVSSYANCPVIMTTWKITYEIMGSPTTDLEIDKETTGWPADYQ